MRTKAESRAGKATDSYADGPLADDLTLRLQIDAAREDERRRIARELHDDLGQRLVLLSMAAAEALDRVPKGLPGLSRRIQAIHRDSAALARDLRRIALQQHSSAALSRGLPQALSELAVDYRTRKCIAADFRAVRVPARIHPSIAYHLYRIAQEALRNVDKHTGDAPVEIRLTGTAKCIRMNITDFGQGFDPVVTHGRSLGLQIMRERASLANGTFLLSSRKGRGTTITVEVPFETKSKEEADGPGHRIDSR